MSELSVLDFSVFSDQFKSVRNVQKRPFGLFGRCLLDFFGQNSKFVVIG